MYKYLYVLAVFVLTLSSCDKLAQKQNEAQLAQIEQAKNEAVNSVNTAKNKAIDDASIAINEKITQALEGATNDISSALMSAKSTISLEVQTSTQEVLKKKTEEQNARITTAYIIGLGGILLGLVALVLAFIISHSAARQFERVNERLNGERRSDDVKMGDMVRDAVREQLKMLPQRTTQATSSVAPVNVRSEIEKFVFSSDTIERITQKVLAQIPQNEQNIKREPNGPSDSSIKSPTNPGVQVNPPRTTQVPLVELYARDSRSEEIPEATSNYLVGKTVYKLLLTSSEAATAEVDLCLDKEDAKGRILDYGEVLLLPICSVTRNANSPSEVVVKERGKAERISNGGWRVIKKPIVEFN